MQTTLAVATIVAIIIGPIVALWIQRNSEKRREKRNRKLVIFKELMATLATTLSPRHVDALNAIEVEFSKGYRHDSCRKYTLRARLEPSGAHEAVERGTGYARVPGDGGFGHAQLEDGEALAAHVLRRGRNPPRGDDFHGLSMKCGVGCFIGQIRNMKRVLFQAAELFGQNVRLCLTAPCRAPTPTSHAPA